MIAIVPMRQKSLRGLRVGVLQARHGEELATLIRRRGGEPVAAPCLREVSNLDDAALHAALRTLAAAPAAVSVFQTGVGSQAVLDAATRAGVGEGYVAGLARGVVVARGPKPLAVLLRRGVRVDRRTVEPHTTARIIEVLAGEDVGGRVVALQRHGAPNPALVDHLRGRGTDVVELVSYRWALPEDVGPVHRLLDALADGRLDVVAFTSAAQVENLFAIAGERMAAAALADLLNRRTRVAAVGPTSAAALEARGVPVAILPGRPKMVPLVDAIAEQA
jgi:uroporphyrinogen-III synthase